MFIMCGGQIFGFGSGNLHLLLIGCVPVFSRIDFLYQVFNWYLFHLGRDGLFELRGWFLYTRRGGFLYYLRGWYVFRDWVEHLHELLIRYLSGCIRFV